MSRTKRFVHGLVLGYFNQVVILITGLAVTPLLLRLVGHSNYGFWLVANQILAYLALADFGIVGMLPRQAAYLTGRAGGIKHAKGLAQIVGRVVTLVLLQMPLIAAAALVVWFYVVRAWPEFKLPFMLLLLSSVLFFPLRIFSAVLQGVQDLAFLSVINLVGWGAGTAVTVFLAFRGAGLHALVAGYFVTSAIVSAGTALRVLHRYPAVKKFRLRKPLESTLNAYFNRSKWVGLANLAHVILNSTDLSIMSGVAGPAGTVPYAMTEKLPSVLANKPQLVMETAAPALSELKAGGRKAHLIRVSVALTELILLVSGAVACLVLAVNRGFIGWWVGGKLFGGDWLTLLVVLNMVFRHWIAANGYTLYCLGKERVLTLVQLSEGILGVGLAILLGLQLGMVGVALGSLIAVVVFGLPVTLGFLARELNIGTTGLLKPLVPWAWRSIVLGTLAWQFGSRVPLSSFIDLAAASSLTLILYGAVMWPLVQSGTLGDYLIPRLEKIGILRHKRRHHEPHSTHTHKESTHGHKDKHHHHSSGGRH
jgi:O-antigen/teichoic acid export membrane protein